MFLGSAESFTISQIQFKVSNASSLLWPNSRCPHTCKICILFATERQKVFTSINNYAAKLQVIDLQDSWLSRISFAYKESTIRFCNWNL